MMRSLGPGHHNAQACLLVGFILRTAAEEHGAELEEPYITDAPGKVVLHSANQSREEAGTQESLFGRDGVGKVLLSFPFRSEGHGLGLQEPFSDQEISELIFDLEQGVVRNRTGAERAKVLRETVEPVRPGNFLEQIHFAPHVIAPEPGNRYRKAVPGEWANREAQRFDEVPDFLLRQLDAEKFWDPGKPERDRETLPGLGSRVEDFGVG
jgi:hypothetical protein